MRNCLNVICKDPCEVLFVEGDEEHDGDARAHAQELECQLFEVGVMLGVVSDGVRVT